MQVQQLLGQVQKQAGAATEIERAPVAIRDLTVAYRDKPVLWDIDLTIPEGRLVAIIGRNGAGKSTLIKSALGLLPAAAGSVSFFGKPYSAQR